MEKIKIQLVPGYAPAKLDRTPFKDGETVEQDKYVDSLIRCGILQEHGDPAGGAGDETDEMREVFEAMTKAELQAAAEDAGLEYKSNASKADLVDLLVAAETEDQ